MTVAELWYVGAAMVALGRNLAQARRSFTYADLRAWSDELAKRPRAAWHAVEALRAHGLVTKGERPQRRVATNQFFVLTPDGIAAAQAARAAQAKASRARSARALSDARRGDSGFADRLWSLLRMRRQLTPDEAAGTLVDVGDDTARATATASCYLRAWAKAHPEAIQRSVRRINHFHRYILVQDLGPQKPAVSRKGAQGGAAAS